MSLCGECQREAPLGAVFCAFCGAPLTGGAGPEVLGALAGKTVARRYFLESLVGRGGMGDVYRATDLDLDRRVVVKLLRRTAAADEGAVARFHREARAAAHLSHPSSVALLDSGETETGLLYMAMELVPGVTLARLLSERGPLPEQRAVSVAGQILDGLAEAHGLGIIHRDLKPANVMIDVRDGQDRVKVLDFGIAIFDRTEPEARLTRHGQVFGTPAYMSPEQVRGEDLDARSDLYSVGVLLYELLTGRLPFDAGTEMELAARHLTDSPPPMAERRPGLAVCPELEALVRSALAKAPADRPRSAEAFRRALLACPVADAGPTPPAPSLAPTAPLDAAAAVQAARRSTGPVPARRTRRARWAVLAGVAGLGILSAAWLAIPHRGAVAPTTSALPPTLIDPSPAPPPAVHLDGAPAAATGPTASDPPAPTAHGDGADRPAPSPPQPSPPPHGGALPPRPTADDARAAKVAAARNRGAPERGRVIHAMRAELNSLPLPPEPSGDGLLALEASPWAEVSVDGERLGETPREVQLRAGVHVIRATHPDLGEREERVTVRAGRRTVWVAAFDR